jgi:hypothetical protein
MSKLLQVGVSTKAELHMDAGHMACTLGGVNYESAHGKGVVKGSSARGAADALFRHTFHIGLTDQQGKLGKRYADSCVHQPYVWGLTPSAVHGGDCSGFVSGIYLAAMGRTPKHLFGTGNFMGMAADLGFDKGLGGGHVPVTDPATPSIGVMDRPYPGFPFNKQSTKSDHVKWIQARLNFSSPGGHSVLHGRKLDIDGAFRGDTFDVTVFFQEHHGLQGLGQVGPKTWALLNQLR